MKKSEWLDCQRNEFFPKQKGIPSLVKIEHKNTATLDSARSKKKKSKVAVLQLGPRDAVKAKPKSNTAGQTPAPQGPGTICEAQNTFFWSIFYQLIYLFTCILLVCTSIFEESS